MARFLGIGGVEDRQVHFAIGKVHRAVLGAVHLFHIEYSLVEISELVRLMRKNREMTELGHYSSFDFGHLKASAIIGVSGCQR
jgi:hypothetical protein